MWQFVRDLFRSRCFDWLESELARERAESERLRAENRALINSLLGTAGFPPLELPESAKPRPVPRLRKRSWHQIQAWRETEAARDAAASDALEDEAPPGHRAVPHS
jgi:hypothetical protein